MKRKAIWLFCGALLTISAAGQATRPTLSVCELFGNLDRWDGRIVRINGLATFREDRFGVRLSMLVPVPPEKGMLRDTQEPEEIAVEEPNPGFLMTSPKDFRFDLTSVINAKNRWEGMVRRDPSGVRHKNCYLSANTVT